ncbi:MAG TPA: NADH-quinone oxidoreductase subunit NuoG [Thermodesulfobacteriota bacterium]|nr:NADH-quinone oxidoreductase subunit NuoG [Thermodesulfobacteriota bacterium]
MPKLTIDKREIEVPKGTKVIEAADRLGIAIPRFCYHPALGSVGACRMCAVMFGEGPVKGIQMSCMIDAQDGMVVSTDHPEAVAFRKQIVEWLMVNHPHDCPVCDEGGQCLLQDMTVSAGHALRRYRGKKRTYRDQYLGPFVQHEMNRCIQCYRCSRFYQEFAGYRDLGPMQIAYRVYFGRHSDGALQSPFAGNLVDICPTGVYTDKPARFFGRRWDFERGPSLCINCSLGCRTVGSARLRRVVMMEAEFSSRVNGYFICDRGRHGFHYASHPERPRRPRVSGQDRSWEDALARAAETLASIARRSGPASIAAAASPRTSMENLAMLGRLCQVQGWPAPRCFPHPSLEHKVRAAVSRLDDTIALSQREMESSDLVVIIGTDLVNEAPMAALPIRQAWRKGATVIVLDPRPVFLPFDFHHLPVHPGEIDGYLKALVRKALDGADPAALPSDASAFFGSLPREYPDTHHGDGLALAEEKLKLSRRPVLVCGTDIVPTSTPSLAAELALLLKAAKGSAGVFYVLPGANAFGASLLTGETGGLLGILDDIEGGRVRALIVLESDPLREYPNRERVEEALRKLECLVVLDYLPSLTAKSALIFFPTQTLYETESSFVNQEGRIQFAGPFFSGGEPLNQVSGGGHPPRVFETDIPGGEPRPAWSVLGDLAGDLTPGHRDPTFSSLWDRVKAEHAAFSGVVPFADPEGRRVIPERPSGRSFGDSPDSERHPPSPRDHDFLLWPVEWTFGTEELSLYSDPIRRAEEEPFLSMHADDASDLGLREKDNVRLPVGGGTVDIELRTHKKMARGVLFLPRHRALDWQKFTEVPAKIGKNDIRKV